MRLTTMYRRPTSAAAIALRAAAVVLLLGAVAACGDGGGGSAPAPAPPAAAPPPAAPPALTCETPPEGIQPFATVRAAVGGTIIGRTDPSFILLQAPDYGGRGFDRWLIYGPDLAQAPVITGVIHASGGFGCDSNNRTARNGGDSGTGVYLRTEIGDSGAGAALLDGGSLRYLTTPAVTYALGPRPLPGIVPNYALSPALLANAVGSWTLNDVSGGALSVDVAADGAFTLRYLGCSLRGNLSVGNGGIYTYSVQGVLEPTSCTSSPWQGFTYEGVGGEIVVRRRTGVRAGPGNAAANGEKGLLEHRASAMRNRPKSRNSAHDAGHGPRQARAHG